MGSVADVTVTVGIWFLTWAAFGLFFAAMTWNDQFLSLFDRCLKAYNGGDKDFNGYYSEDDLKFLASIGYKPREFFDFVEDMGDGGEPTASTALLVAAVRRDHFHVVQDGQTSSLEIAASDLPSFGDELEGIAYLPRIIKKARHKLRGELDPDLMFSCGGDRNFLATHGNIHPADFLRHVWSAEDDDAKIAAYVRAHD